MNVERPPIPIRKTFRQALGVIVRYAGDYARAILLVQGVMVVIAGPFLVWLFGFLLDVTRKRSLGTIGAFDVLADPVAVSIVLSIAVAGGAFVLLQVLTFLTIASTHQRGERPTWRGSAVQVGRSIARLAHPSTLLLIPYLFLVLPLGNLGIGGLLTQGLRVPAFLTTELLPRSQSIWVYVGIVLVLLYVSTRLLLTLPALVGGERTIARAMAASWRMTSGQSARLLVLVGAVVALAVTFSAGVAAVGLAPTRYVDAEFPALAPAVAIVSLALIELAIFLVTGLAASVVANILVRAVRLRRRENLELPAPSPRPLGPRINRVGRVAGVTAVGALVGVLALSSASTISSVTDGSDTLVIAHRGLQSAGVENSLRALEAAAVAGADYVEIDVQLTADGEFVVTHDSTLTRLSGDPRRIEEVPLAELRAVVVRQNGFTARISTLEEFIVRAKLLEQPLLLDMKPRADYGPEYVDALVELLHAHDVVGSYMVASLNKKFIEELEAREPALPTGYIVAFNLGRAPATTADFLVIQQRSYTPALRDNAWNTGLEIFVWTVDDPTVMRDLFRDSVAGIITDVVDIAVEEKEDLLAETGIASRLEDVVRRAFGF